MTFATGAGPRAVAVADVNGDGKPDLIVANYSANDLSVLLGNGNGTFQSQHTFATGSQPRSIAIADLNLDGKPDVIVANHGGNSVSVLLGNGNGSFQPQQTYATGATPFSVTTADVNLDGKPDVIVANNGSDSVGVLLGTGAGTLAPQQTIAAGFGPIAVAVSDVNGDGKPDLIVANYNAGDVGVDLGNGDGTFQAQKVFPTAGSPRAVAVADLNGDGREDLVTANSNVNNVSVLLGNVPPRLVSIDRANPSGTFTTDSTVTYTVTFSEPVTGVDLADFSLALSGGVTAAPPVVLSGSGAVYSVTINGISGTGTLGLNLVDDGGIQDAAGDPLQPTATAQFSSPMTLAVGTSPVWMISADVNGDGTPDLVVANRDSNSVGVLLSNGNGSFQPQITSAVSMPYFVAAADVNGDGKVDLITVDHQTNSVSVLLGIGGGTFQAPITYATGADPYSVTAADLNGDGKIDLIIPNHNNLSILLGNGNGTFQPQFTIAGQTYANRVVVADVNGDGRPDIVAKGRGGSYVSVLIQHYNGTFPTEGIVAMDGGAGGGLAVEDLNGDGWPDLATASANGFVGASVSVALAKGYGGFHSAVGFMVSPILNRSWSIAIADINGDGKPDLIAAQYTQAGSMGLVYDHGVSVLLGNGDGTFQSQLTFAAGPYETGLTVADFNGDGRPDVAVANTQSNTVTVLLGPTDGSFAGQTYTIVQSQDIITGTSDTDFVTLRQDPDHQHIDWFLNTSTANTFSQFAINDPNGLTINGMGSGADGGDQISLDYSNGNPLPALVRLNEPQPSNFVISGMSGTDPLATTTLDIGKSQVFLDYLGLGSPDPVALVRSWLAKGYNGGSWTGTVDAITSSAAAANHAAGLNSTAIGYADSADGRGVNAAPSTIELKYTLYGDANLAGQVNSADLQILLANLNRPGAWDQGDFNYDGQVNSADLQSLLFTLNTSLGSQATPMAVAATPAAVIPGNVSQSQNDLSASLVPAIQPTGPTTTPVHHPHRSAPAGRKRR